MLSTFAQWRAQTRDELTEVGTEVDVDGVLASDAGGRVRVRGRVDRLERDAAGRLVIVDVKTGKTPVSKDDAQRHAQLAMYQLAVAEGLLPHGDTPGGGRLVYLGKTAAGGATEREQDALTAGRRAAVARAGAAGGGRDARGRSSSRGSTTAARTARCGRSARPRRPPADVHDASCPLPEPLPEPEPEPPPGCAAPSAAAISWIIFSGLRNHSWIESASPPRVRTVNCAATRASE